jgi:hypothetical protein
MLYAFDLLELDGEDLRDMPLGDRKKRLAELLGRRRIGIVLSDHTTEDGALCARVSLGPRRHRVKAAERALPARPVARLAQGQDPDSPAMIWAREAVW